MSDPEKTTKDEVPKDRTQANPLEEALLLLIARRDSIAPRDVAEMVVKPGKDWRHHLKEIKSIGKRLEKEGRIVFLRKGKPVSSEGLKGVYRFSRKDRFPDFTLEPATK